MNNNSGIVLRVLTVFCCAFLAVLAVRWRLYLMPHFLASSETGGILDTRFWYSAAEGYRVLEGFSAASFALYREILIWDMLLPFAYCFLALRTFTLVPFFRRRLWFIPLAAMIADYLENVLLFPVMTTYPARHDVLMMLGNIAGSVKYLFQYATWFLMLVSLFVFTVGFVRSKQKRTNAQQ
jgi:hypothetical protein